MKNIKDLNQQDKDLFKDALENIDGVVHPIKQDKIHLTPQTSKSKTEQFTAQHKKQQAEFFFSDQYLPDLSSDGPLKWVREDQDSYLAKQLRRGDYYPDIELDLHGCNIQTTKLELAAFIDYCRKQHIHCGCIIHGKGQHVLKQKIPHYLVQHPNILAFHQAPKELGGQSAILVLFDIPQR